ncbi:Wadjet anti-phage system protein JetD domain-containing protein [Pseudomonas sp. NPDC087615]|uniref:Wadjet anti-phage system protein JetD domain-containing protein n=1 Tax=Pseudomonas sp. NPDC087615 TaxID=3364443 RepID=UPI003828579A
MDMSEQVETVLRRLTAGGKKLRPRGLIRRLSKLTAIPQLDVQLALEELARAGSLSGVSKSGQPLTLVGWTGAALPLSQTEMLLSEVIENFSDESSKTTLQPLLKIAELFSGLSADDINYVIQGMLQCRKGSINCDPIFASAANILGSAKALNNLRGAARNIGLEWPSDAYGELYVLTAGPARPNAVVLIENIRSFTAFARSRHAKHSVGVAAFGYGLTMENFGNRLAAGQIVACCAYGDTVNLYDVISQQPAFFWGDLDREGMRIYESLRRQIPDLELSAAYTHMDKRLTNPQLCHPYHALFEKDGQRVVNGATPGAAYLAKRCTHRAVDQEALGSELNEVEVVTPFRIPQEELSVIK